MGLYRPGATPQNQMSGSLFCMAARSPRFVYFSGLSPSHL